MLFFNLQVRVHTLQPLSWNSTQGCLPWPLFTSLGSRLHVTQWLSKDKRHLSSVKEARAHLLVSLMAAHRGKNLFMHQHVPLFNQQSWLLKAFPCLPERAAHPVNTKQVAQRHLSKFIRTIVLIMTPDKRNQHSYDFQCCVPYISNFRKATVIQHTFLKKHRNISLHLPYIMAGPHSFAEWTICITGSFRLLPGVSLYSLSISTWDKTPLN